MPFSLCLGYLANADYLWWYTPLSIQYMSNGETVQFMVMLGFIGLCGLVSGILFGVNRRPKSFAILKGPCPVKTIALTPFILLLLVAFAFSYINTPTNTIFDAVYDADVGMAGKWNFNGAFVVAYTLIAALYIDALNDATNARGIKQKLIYLTTGFIVIFFQLLRGDRDCFGLLVAMAVLYIEQNIDVSGLVNRLLLVGLLGCVLLFAFLAIQFVRTRIFNGEAVDITEAAIEGGKESTWGAVLLTNLSLSAQYKSGQMEFENGKTYFDYIISVPPGFITSALGIVRPIERDQGPNFWFTDISSGGIHIVTVPFKNFHVWGSLFYMYLVGLLIGKTQQCIHSGRWQHRLWHASLLVGSAQWFWYGDITFIRQFMAFIGCFALYGYILNSRKRTSCVG
jgi:hypothetical protein